MKNQLLLVAALVLFSASSTNVAQDKFHVGFPFAVDGVRTGHGVSSETREFHFLPNRNPIAATGAFNIVRVSARTNRELLYLFLELAEPINLQSGPKEDGTLQLIIGANGKQLTIDFRARVITDGTKKHIGWKSVDFQCLPTYASKEFEIQLNLSRLGVKVGDTITVDFAGSDNLGEPAQLVIREPEIFEHNQDLVLSILERKKFDHDFRIVSQNTLQNGLADPKRQEKFKRLFAAANADVYCFQEEWNKEKFVEGLSATFPANGKNIHYQWNGGCAVATCHEMNMLPMKLDRAVAVLVTLETGSSVVVICAHFKCCGHSGSQEDDLRVQQAQQLVAEINKMRNGAFGEVAQLSPVVLIGEYNLVGSRRPLEILNKAGLNDVLCIAPDGSAYTWRGLKPDESFWPGRLDLVSIGSTRPPTGYILDSARLSEEQLAKLKLKKDDSTASDHLTVICEFVR